MNQLSANQKKKAAAIAQLNARLLLTIKVLDSDVNFAAKEWRKNPASQFWRRTLVRCICALVEGTLSMMKNLTTDTASYFGVILNDKDVEIAAERRTFMEQGVQKSKPAFLPFADNLKATFKLFAKAHGMQMSIKYEEPGFGYLCQTFETRNKLMHPKGPFDVGVSDKAVDTADRGMQWFDLTLQSLLEVCSKKLPFSKTSQ